MLKTSLYKLQKKAVKLYAKRKEIALFMEPGTGKTITAFALVDQKQRKRNKHLLCLVLCPKNLIGSWEDELKDHMDDYQFFGSWKDFIKGEIDTTLSYTFLVINYEQMRARIDELVEIDWDFVIPDESHRAKNRKAQTTKALWKLAYVRYKLLLSGTPITKDEIDLWSQFKFLNPFLWGSNFKTFTKKALREIDLGGYKKLRPHKQKIKVFMKKAQDFTYHLKLDDMVEMPSRNDIPIKLTMKGALRKAYNELEYSFLTEYEGKRSSIDLSVTSLLRLQQLSGGHLILENGDAIRFKDQPKLWWILDKLQDLGKEKVLIICRYTYEIELLSDALNKLKYSHEIMRGGMKPQEVKRVRQSFQSKKGCQILLGQIGVVKEGNNFQKFCRYTIFYSKSMSYVDIDQCKRRTWRNGQTRKVIYYHLILENTIDESIEHLIDKKTVNAEEALMKLVYNKRRLPMATKTKAKVEKKTKAKTEKKAEAKSGKLEMPEFGVAAVAEGLGVDARTARLKLRNAEVEKTGRTYDFKNQTGVDKIVKQLSKADKTKD